jgi:hypothetical protein
MGDPEAVLLAVQATGAHPLEALGLAARIDLAWALPRILEELGKDKAVVKGFDSDRFIKTLDRVAMGCPEAANAALEAWLRPVPAAGRIHCWTLPSSPWLTSLPDGLRTSGWIHLTGCPNLAALPCDLNVNGGIYADNCPALTMVGAKVQIVGGLHLSGCEALSSLGDNLAVGQDLILKGCVRLRALPEGLVVGRALDLNGCSSLVSLPPRLLVEGELDLRGCSAWDGLIAPDTYVNSLRTDRHPNGASLDQWRAWHPQGESRVALRRSGRKERTAP